MCEFNEAVSAPTVEATAKQVAARLSAEVVKGLADDLLSLHQNGATNLYNWPNAMALVKTVYPKYPRTKEAS